jgi:shikimate dehydrogenase
VVFALHQLGIKTQVVSRNASSHTISYTSIDANTIVQNLLLVNTTPLGTWPHTNACVAIPYEALTHQHYCIDLVYNPAETQFMKNAAKYGAKTQNGLVMLHGQALASWKIWNR